jgi:hypothetical protein|nr:MAG TPA_asm: hypothetical protein [Caudoviricetes sp.]
MKISQYDSVVLKDGRRAAVVEVWDETHFLVDVGSSPKDWDTIEITMDDIKSVVDE